MTFPEIVKTTLWDIIDEMSRSLSSFVKNPDKDFIRKRKLDFKKMMHLIISMESGSLNHELLKFFEYDSSVPTGSAFYQQRSKLSVSAFRHLLKEFKSTEEWLNHIEEKLSYQKWYCGHYHTEKKIDKLEIMFENFDEFCAGME